MPAKQLAKNAQVRYLTSPARKSLRRFSAEARRRLTASSHTITYYHRADDPYSHLMVQALPRLQKTYNVEIVPRVVRTLPADSLAMPELAAAYALEDAARLTGLYPFLQFPANPVPPESETVLKASLLLAAYERQDCFFEVAETIGAALWYGMGEDLGAIEAQLPKGDERLMAERLAANEGELVRRGHYMSAMLHYGGEWYWGIDRLDHLERRLIGLGAERVEDQVALFDHGARALMTRKAAAAPSGPLAVFFSLRSPYSYIGLERAIEFADYHGLDLVLKPVLPMVMRGLPVPRAKQIYIILDAKREAEELGIGFGNFADPVGTGIERAFALAAYARSEGRELTFFQSLARAVWRDGLDLATDAGLEKAATRAGLDWGAAKPHLADESWREWAEANRAALTSLGLWGVPVYKYGGLAVWGQDRLWAIERAILEDVGVED